MKLYPLQIQQGLSPAHLHRAAQLYFSAFTQQISPILGVNTSAVEFVQKCINPQHAVTATLDGRLAGFVGLQYSGQSFLQLRLSQFTQNFGWLLGRIHFREANLFSQPLQQPLQEGDVRIEGIAVEPELRGRGVGTWLLNAATEFAGKQGFRAVHIDVPDTAPDLFQLCRRMGFNYVSTQTWNFLKPFGISTFTTLTKTV
jgi:ribosomal protein S18 acetylase RimI-like enzyme